MKHEILATSGQVERISKGIERLAGEEMIPWLENATSDVTMEHTPKWLRMGTDVYQAHTLQVNGGKPGYTYEQNRWRLDSFAPFGGLSIPAVVRSEVQVNRYTTTGEEAKKQLPKQAHRQEYPLAITLHDGQKTASRSSRYLATAGSIRNADEIDLFIGLQALESTIREPDITQANDSSVAETPQVDMLRFAEILDAAREAPSERSPIELAFSSLEPLNIIDAQRTLSRIRRLRSFAEVIEKPNELPE